MIHLWDAARLWLWIHPWYHATILFGTPVVISTILGLWGLHHSREANRLSGENNRLSGEANVLRADTVRIGEEQKNSVVRIEQLQGERNRLQTELNELQAKRNVSLDQIAVGVKKDLTPAEKTAAKVRKYIGQPAYVTKHDGSSWGSMGAIIAEVNDDIRHAVHSIKPEFLAGDGKLRPVRQAAIPRSGDWWMSCADQDSGVFWLCG